MELFVAQLLNGLVYGVLLFLMAAGLSLIFGLMNVVSLAHGSFFMLGAYFGLSIFQLTGSFWLAFVLAPIPVIVLGIVMEAAVPASALSPRPYGSGAADVRLHFRLSRSGADACGAASVLRLPAPPALQGTVHIGLGVFSAYRLFLIGFGFAIALAAVAVAGTQPDRRHGACRRRQCGDGGGPRRQYPGAVYRHFRASASRSPRSAASRRRRCSASIREWTPKFSFRLSSSS